MPFTFPQPHMTNLYGWFKTMAEFWDEFEANPAWARGFYALDGGGQEDDGREVFKLFVNSEAAKHNATQCVWFSPQRRSSV